MAFAWLAYQGASFILLSAWLEPLDGFLTACNYGQSSQWYSGRLICNWFDRRAKLKVWSALSGAAPLPCISTSAGPLRPAQ
jgi:hypothetical protein